MGFPAILIIIVGTGAVVSGAYLNTTSVFIFGHMETEQPIEEIVGELRKNDSVSFTMLGSANMIYVSGLLRRSADMEPFQEFVRKVCHMRDSIIAIESLGAAGETTPPPEPSPRAKLSPLDLRIIASLHLDARKPYGEIAKEVGASAKTVRMHLDRMRDEGTIELLVRGDTGRIQGIVSIVHVYVKEGVDRNAMGIEAMNRFPDQMFMFRSYSNMPTMISLATVHPTMSELREMVNRLKENEKVHNVVPNIIISTWWFDTWRERMLPKLSK